MIIYMVTATNNETGVIDHIGTSDGPFTINPFEGMSQTHDIEFFELETRETELIRAREILDNIDSATKQINSNKIDSLRRIQ